MQLVIASIVFIATTSAHLVRLTRSVLLPANKSLLLILLSCLNLGEVLPLPINYVLPARIHPLAWHLTRPALAVD